MSFFNYLSESVAWFMVKINKANLAPWDKNRKKQFLLNCEVKKPLSIDDAVWDHLDKSHTEFLTNDVELHPDFELNKDHVTILITMPPKDYSRIIHFFDHSNIYYPKWLQCINQHGLNFNFLGYDIADFMLMSGISNCGYEDNEKKLFEPYLPFINEYGLISDLDVAGSIRQMVDKRVSEHAPFYIFGIYEVETTLRPRITTD